MIWRLHGPPDGQLFGIGRYRTTVVAAREHAETLVNVRHCLLQG